jgi:hypothetical protein
VYSWHGSALVPARQMATPAPSACTGPCPRPHFQGATQRSRSAAMMAPNRVLLPMQRASCPDISHACAPSWRLPTNAADHADDVRGACSQLRREHERSGIALPSTG